MPPVLENSVSQDDAEIGRLYLLHTLINRSVITLAGWVNAARCIISVAATHFEQLLEKTSFVARAATSWKMMSATWEELK